MDDIDPAKLEAALDQLQAEKERRLQAKVEAGELVTVPLCVAVSTASKAPAAVEQAQTRKLGELRAAGEEREVRFDTTVVVTGVAAPGEDIGEEWKPVRLPDVAEPLLHEDEDSPRSWKATCGFKRDRAATMATIPVKLWRGGFPLTTGL